MQQGWISGYTDGSFRPDNTVTLEEACTAALTLLGYDITTLTGGFPAAQLNKANAIGLRSNLGCTQGQTMTLEEGAVLLYNALTANTADGSVYGTTLGYTVTNGQVDVSSILLSSLEGPFVASEGESLPFVPEAVYRNGSVTYTITMPAQRRCGSTPARRQAGSQRCRPAPAHPPLLSWRAPATPVQAPRRRHSCPA